MNKIKLLDTFAGIGGFHLGVKRACNELGIDFECVGAIEFDKNARVTYAANFPDVDMFDEWGGDITKIPLDNIPDHDVLTGGFPCQPFSRAGKAYQYNKQMLVADDDRANLFEFLIKILIVKQPEYCIFENVKGILNLKNSNGELVSDLIVSCMENAGYNVTIQTISAHDVGTPQKRERVFFIGCRKPRQVKKVSLNVNCYTLSHILEHAVDTKYHIAHQKQWKQLGNIIKRPKYDLLLESFNSRKSKHVVSTTKPVLAAEINNDTPCGRSRQRDRAYCVTGLSPTLNTTDKKVIYDGVNFRYLTEIECLRLQGFPDDFVYNNSTNLYRQIGNAVCVDVVYNIVKDLICATSNN